VKLSVHIVCYNQEQFIAQTLDSVLAQRGVSDYEILVSDDCSTDLTPSIIKDYHRRFPSKIKPILRQKNVGPGPNAVEALEQCSGEYIAFLEGDDYWTDPDKLRLQIAFLDEHPGCALVHHKVEHISWPSNQITAERPPLPYRTERVDVRLLAKTNFIQTCSVMFRRKWLPVLDQDYRGLKIGDWPLFVLLSQQGWIGYIDQAMAHYRVHEHNAWNNRAADYKLRAMESMAWYLRDRVKPSSQTLWEDTILALAFKDFALSFKPRDWMKGPSKLKQFLKYSVAFKKPFWIFNRLWPYYRATTLSKNSPHPSSPAVGLPRFGQYPVKTSANA
jgi:glycosyltransferase involved in cell wall biosynthesis